MKTSAPVFRNGVEMLHPFAGGMDAPQFSQADLNRDGLMDVFVFDRQGNTAIPFVTWFEEGVFGYDIQWDVLTHLPELQNWALMLDFNGDGVEDLFASTNQPGVQGIDVYRGREEEGKIRFEKMLFDLGPYDLLYFKLGSDFTALYAAWIDIPVIADIDGDSDIDILAFEPAGSLLYYYRNIAVENGLGLDTFLFEWRDVCWGKFSENTLSDAVVLSPSPGQCAQGIVGEIPVQPRHAGSASCVMDIDADGDQDLFLGDLTSPRIKLLFNGGSPAQAWITDVDNAFASGNIAVHIPDFVAPFSLDINHDGIRDLVTASNNPAFSQNYEVAWFYANNGNGDTAEFHLEETTLFVSEMLDYGSEAKPAFFDYNADGLMDIIIGTGGFYTPELERDARLVLLENIGSKTEPAYEVIDEDYQSFSAFVTVPTWEFAPAAGDIDTDGDTDLIIGDRNGNLFFLENVAGPDATAQFAAPVYPYMGMNVGTSSTPTLIDLNGDGLLDIVCGERVGNNDNDGRCSNLNYFQNVGIPGNAQFIADPSQAPNSQCLGRVIFGANPAIPEYSAPAFAPTPDGLRLLTGSETGEIRMYRDIGEIGEAFTLDDPDYGEITDGGRIVPDLADLTSDGFYEMIVGNKRGGLTLYNTDLRVLHTAVKDVSVTGAFAFLAPNPTDGLLRLFLQDPMHSVDIEIRDIYGHLIMTKRECMNSTVLHLTCPEGVYLAVFRADNQQFVQRIVVK